MILSSWISLRSNSRLFGFPSMSTESEDPERGLKLVHVEDNQSSESTDRGKS